MISNTNTKVVIFCGGLGTRLREETEFRPKPMVEIGGKPILWHIMKIYAQYGFNNFVLCLGYKGEMIKDYFYHYHMLNNDFTINLGSKDNFKIHGNCEEANWQVTLADTGDTTLKGARLKKIEKYIDTENFFLTYGDGVSDINIKKLLKYHQDHGKIATVSGVNSASRFGQLKIKGDIVNAFAEKPRQSQYFINGGFFVLNRKIFDYVNNSEACDFEVGPLEEIAAKGELMVYKHPGFWACMDTYRDMEHLNGLWKKHQADWKIW